MTLTQRTLERFWSKVDRSGGLDACWNWTAGLNTHGYGRFGVEAKGKWTQWLAHRVAFMIGTGIDPGLFCVLHSCDNPGCVNHRHLSLGTPADNVADMNAKGRHRPCRGASNGRAKLTEADVAVIRIDGRTQLELGRAFGVSQATVSAIQRGDNWQPVAA